MGCKGCKDGKAKQAEANKGKVDQKKEVTKPPKKTTITINI